MIEVERILTHINKIAEKCRAENKTADEFLNEILNKNVFSSFLGPFAYPVLEREKRTVIFQKAESLKAGNIAVQPKIVLTLSGLYKSERDAWTSHADWSMRKVVGNFRIEYDSKVLFSFDYAFNHDVNDQFKKVLFGVFKEYYSFYKVEHAAYSEQQAVERARREAERQAEEDRKAQRKAELVRKAAERAERKAEKDRIAALSPEERQCEVIDKHNTAFKQSIEATNSTIDTPTNDLFYAIGYLAATATRLYAKVPVFVENQLAMYKSVNTFEDIFPGSDYYTVNSVTNPQGNPTQMDISCSLYLPQRASDPDIAPSYLVATDGTGLPGTASGVANEFKENAGGLRPTGQLSNNKFINRLVKNYGFTFNKKGENGCAPSLSDLLSLVPSDKQDSVEDGYNYGLEVLKLPKRRKKDPVVDTTPTVDTPTEEEPTDVDVLNQDFPNPEE